MVYYIAINIDIRSKTHIHKDLKAVQRTNVIKVLNTSAENVFKLFKLINYTLIKHLAGM